jgi:hypothetical protein
MATTAIVRLHDGWDCTWSLPGQRREHAADAQQPHGAWVCTREGHRRSVTDAECSTCSHFQARAGSMAWLLAREDTRPTKTGHQVSLWTRALLVFTALVFAAIGVVSLSGPMAVPFTVTMWLSAAGFAGLAAFWTLPEH